MPPWPHFSCSPLSWLARTVPPDSGRTSLVHSDMGPGNFLYQDGRVTAVVDWEVAHWGDAMGGPGRRLGARHGHAGRRPADRFAEYAAASAVPVDLQRVQWYRVLVLTRNAMQIGLGLARDSAALDRVQLTMYRTLLMRADALALCDAIGVDRPVEPPLAAGDDPADGADLVLLAHAGRDQGDVVVPELEDPFAAQRRPEASVPCSATPSTACGTAPTTHPGSGTTWKASWGTAPMTKPLGTESSNRS